MKILLVDDQWCAPKALFICVRFMRLIILDMPSIFMYSLWKHSPSLFFDALKIGFGLT